MKLDMVLLYGGVSVSCTYTNAYLLDSMETSPVMAHTTQALL